MPNTTLVDHEGFTLVQQTSDHTHKASALFKFLTQDKSILKKLKTSGKITEFHQPSNKPYLLLTLPQAAKDNIFASDGFNLDKCHIRVDEFYYKPTTSSLDKLFSHWHYTEQYANPQTKETLVLHVYYNHGAYLYTYLKQANNELIHLDTQTTVNQALTNSMDARDIINQLLINVENKRQNLRQELEQHLKNFANLHYVLASEDCASLEQEYQHTKALSNELNNLYEDCLDTRYLFLERILATKPTAEPQSSAKAKKAASKVVNAKPTTSLEKPLPKGNKLAEVSNQIKLLLTQQQTLAPIEVQIQKQELNFELIILALNSSPAQLTHIEKLMDKLENIPNFYHKIINDALEGDVDNFIKHFDLMYLEIPPQFYADLFLIKFTNLKKTPENVDKIDNYIRLLEFLYNKSEHYRRFISYVDKICIKINDNILCSLMLHLAMIKNNKLFMLIFKQAQAPIWQGISIDGHACSLITAISRISEDDSIKELLQFLIEHHENIAFKPSDYIQYQVQKISEHKSLSMFCSSSHSSYEEGSLDTNARVAQDFYTMFKDVAIVSHATLAYFYNIRVEQELTEFLSNQASPKIVALCLAKTLNDTIFSLNPNKSNEFSINLFTDKDIAEAFIKKFILSTSSVERFHITLLNTTNPRHLEIKLNATDKLLRNLEPKALISAIEELNVMQRKYQHQYSDLLAINLNLAKALLINYLPPSPINKTIINALFLTQLQIINGQRACGFKLMKDDFKQTYQQIIKYFLSSFNREPTPSTKPRLLA